MFDSFISYSYFNCHILFYIINNMCAIIYTFLQNFEELKHFVNKNRFPLVSKIDHYSFFNIRSSGNTTP